MNLFTKTTLLASVCVLSAVSNSNAGEIAKVETSAVAVERSPQATDILEILEWSLHVAIVDGDVRSANLIYDTIIEVEQNLLSGNSGSPKSIAGLPAGSGRIKNLSGVPAGSGR